MKIIQIKEENNHAQITLSDKTILKIPLTIVLETKLVSGTVLTDSQIELLKKEDDFYRCQEQAKKYIAAREHATGEIKLKLKKKSFSENAIENAVKKLKQLGFLNDEKYATMIAEKIIEKKPCGPSFLKSYLQTKSISRELSERISDYLYMNRDMKELAVLSLQKKWYMYQDLELEDAQNKAYNYLARRGFSYELAKIAFSKMKHDKNEE